MDEKEASEMIAFLIVFLVGVAVGVGGTLLIAFVRARALIKDFMASMNPQEEKPQKESEVIT